LHARDDSLETDAGKLHIFGGGYMPDSEKARAVDLPGFKATAQRELKEATGIEAVIEDDTPMLLATDDSCKEEKGIRFFQVNYIYCDISAKEFKSAKKTFEAIKNLKMEYKYTWEGEPFSCELNELRSIVENDNFDGSEFAMSGKAHILAWMRLGCPGVFEVGSKSESARKAQNLFYEMMKKRGIPCPQHNIVK